MNKLNNFFLFMQKNWGWIVSFVGVIGGLVVYVYTRLKAVQMGVQAMLRAQMITYYDCYEEKGFAPIYARDSFENCWEIYEKLGKNGVMQDLRNKFLALPTRDN